MVSSGFFGLWFCSNILYIFINRTCWKLFPDDVSVLMLLEIYVAFKFIVTILTISSITENYCILSNSSSWNQLGVPSGRLTPTNISSKRLPCKPLHDHCECWKYSCLRKYSRFFRMHELIICECLPCSDFKSIRHIFDKIVDILHTALQLLLKHSLLDQSLHQTVLEWVQL